MVLCDITFRPIFQANYLFCQIVLKLCSKEFDLERSEDDPPEEESSDKLLGSKFPDDKSELNCEPESPAEDLAEEFSGEAPTLHQN